MTFYGKGAEPKEPTPPLRKFRFHTGGGDIREIKADGVVFGPAHVQFWRNQPDKGSSLLVEAVANTSVNYLQEVAPDEA